MARRPRLYFPDTAHHILMEASQNEACFNEETDYLNYLELLSIYQLKFSVSVHSYVLMPDHIHLLLTPQNDESLGKFIQAMGRQYVRKFNRKYQRSGSLWQARYRSTLVQGDNYFLQVSRYIELNPLRKNLVERAASYRWSSYAHNALGKLDPIITEHAEYLKLGETASARQALYRQQCRKRLSPTKQEMIRDCTRNSWVLGDDDFKTKVQAQTGIATQRVGRGGDRKSMAYLQSVLAGKAPS